MNKLPAEIIRVIDECLRDLHPNETYDDDAQVFLQALIAEGFVVVRDTAA